MEKASYIELNVVCIILLIIILAKRFNRHSTMSASQICMRRLILTACVLCVSDIFAIIFVGKTFSGARIWIELTNLIYFETIPLIALFWLEYVYAKTGVTVTKRRKVFLSVPIILFTALAVSNPFTQILFRIDENNMYVRGYGIFLHWIVSWAYLLAAGIVSRRAYRAAQSWNKKNEYRPFAAFIIFPAVCCVIQMLMYGISVVQVGVTLSAVLVNFQIQDDRISIDELTGIHNRTEMTAYVERLINRYKPLYLNVIVIDVNNFKQINDTLGHSVGDMALRDVANALKTVCESIGEQLFICRYGGDEFVVVGRNSDEEFLKNLKNMLESEAAEISVSASRPYKLGISAGIAECTCSSMADFENCISEADKAMYAEKESLKLNQQ